MPIDDRPSMIIRGMHQDDLRFAAKCTSAEGWMSEDRTTLEGFFINNSEGCLLAEENGQPVGICIATCYGASGFIGELIVHPENRGKGVGAGLLKHGVRGLKERGVETVYLDGVLKAVQLYERNGFIKVCRSWRFSGNLAGKKSTHVRKMTVRDLDQVFTLDKASFGADRSFFLKRRVELFPELSYVMVKSTRITGFILGRGGKNWIAAGPWVVDGSDENPADLLNAFASEANDRPISIGILDSNPQACRLVQSLGFVARPDSPWRMVSGSISPLGVSPSCYAVGSAAKG
jgi:ribosomal protein S18 acetylase RimI-like enzyme